MLGLRELASDDHVIGAKALIGSRSYLVLVELHDFLACATAVALWVEVLAWRLLAHANVLLSPNLKVGDHAWATSTSLALLGEPATVLLAHAGPHPVSTSRVDLGEWTHGSLALALLLLSV